MTASLSDSHVKTSSRSPFFSPRHSASAGMAWVEPSLKPMANDRRFGSASRTMSSGTSGWPGTWN